MKPGSKSDQTTCRRQSEAESENTESEIEGGDTDIEKWGEAGIRGRPRNRPPKKPPKRKTGTVTKEEKAGGRAKRKQK
jgi:hypothetical protein